MKKKALLIFASILGLTGCDFSAFFESESSYIKSPSFQEVRKNNGYHDLSSLGKASILVIPVAFKDCSLSETQIQEALEKINLGFFGKSEDTYWESLASFYEKSSYGNLSITGKVSDVFHFDKTVSETARLLASDNEPTYAILPEAFKWYDEKYHDLASFDANNDHYIDAIWFVYLEDEYQTYFEKHRFASKNQYIEDLLWAYTYWYDRNSSFEVKPFSYSWASYTFFDEGNQEKADAHTFIHETGHLLGLDDYYNYDYSPTLLGDKTKPCGSLDMMDNNILDHNAYSKALLGWINPSIVLQNGIYELNDFQKNGEALIIPASSWNDTYCDEYLIIEYYTPTGLNELDSTTPYAEINPLGFNEEGFKIYHIDSRIGLYSPRNLEFKGYFDGTQNSKDYYLQIANSNTPSYSAIKDNKLLRLLSPLGSARLDFVGDMNVHAENMDLFQKDDTLSSSFHFNSSNKKVSIRILTSSSSKGSLQIEIA